MQARRNPPFPPSQTGQGPTLQTLHMVEAVLRRQDRPVSLNRLKTLLPRQVMHRTLRLAVDHYKRLGCASEGSKGVLWTLNSDPRFWAAVEAWERR